MTGSKACRALALALVMGWPLAAAAADAGKRITGPEVVRILHDEGYKAQLDKDGDGDPMIRTRMSGFNVYVYFYDCQGGACGSLKLVVGFDLKAGTTPEVLNRFGRAYRYARTYLDEEADPFMEYDFEVLHTHHAAHIASQLDIWENLLDAFARATDYHGSGSGRGRDDGDGPSRSDTTRTGPMPRLQ